MWTGVESQGISLGNSGCLQFSRTNGKTTGVHRCTRPMRHSYSKLALRLHFLMKSAPSFCSTHHPISTRFGKLCILQTLCYRYQEVVCDSLRTGFRIHSGLALGLKSSDIFRRFVSHRMLQPTYRCCIMTKMYMLV